MLACKLPAVHVSGVPQPAAQTLISSLPLLPLLPASGLAAPAPGPPLPPQVGPKQPPVELNPDGSLNFESVMANYDIALDWLAELYANTMNVIHFMHDK